MKTLLPKLLCVLLAAAVTCAEAAPPQRPNILFIYADDWGFGDLACHGHPHLKTPHLDRLAKEGTDFHQFTVCNPVCSPSRVAIVTGQYPVRHGVHQHFASSVQNAERNMPDWLDPKAPLLPRVLKEAGYVTGHFGKWHLSAGGADPKRPLPAEYGYDDSAVWGGPGKSVFEGSSVSDRAGNAGEEASASALTIAATDHAERFIREHAGKPFYINLWIHETHHVIAATDEDKKAYPDTAEPQRTYYSAITRGDKQVGRLLTLLDELKIANNTLIVFSSDNGPEHPNPSPQHHSYFSVGDTGGLKGRKRSLYLGGVNVPFIVRWPGVVPAGRVDKTSILCGADFFPTVLAALDLKGPAGYQSDGVNVLPAFQGEAWQRPQPVFWEWRGPHRQDVDWPTHAVRDGDHILLHDEKETRVELYNVIRDRNQQTNLAATQPETVAALKAKLDQWRKTIPPFVQNSIGRETAEGGKGAGKPKPQPGSKPSSPDRAAVFKRLDVNADDKLTLEEYSNGLKNANDAAQRFQTFDKDSDGKISEQEFVKPNP